MFTSKRRRKENCEDSKDDCEANTNTGERRVSYQAKSSTRSTKPALRRSGRLRRARARDCPQMSGYTIGPSPKSLQ